MRMVIAVVVVAKKVTKKTELVINLQVSTCSLAGRGKGVNDRCYSLCYRDGVGNDRRCFGGKNECCIGSRSCWRVALHRNFSTPALGVLDMTYN